MRQVFMGLTLAVACHLGTARGDELLYSYEGDVFPWEGGWSGSDARCEPPCHESLEDGHFVMRFIGGPDSVQYKRVVALTEEQQPPTLWVEWNFRSNTRFDVFFSFSCGAAFAIQYENLFELVDMVGDGASSIEGSDFVLGLDPSQFHTYRFESLDAHNYTISVDGEVFIDASDAGGTGWSFIDMLGAGAFACRPPDPVDEWDFVRYGTIGTGEQLVGVDPPAGTIAAAEGAQFRSFTLTFDKPAYLYIDDITVSTTGGLPPTISATKRLDNGPAEVLQVVFRHALPPGETTTFTFDTGNGPQSVSYFRERPEIPAASEWGLVVMALIGLVAGSVTIGAAGSA